MSMEDTQMGNNQIEDNQIEDIQMENIQIENSNEPNNDENINRNKVLNNLNSFALNDGELLIPSRFTDRICEDSFMDFNGVTILNANEIHSLAGNIFGDGNGTLEIAYIQNVENIEGNPFRGCTSLKRIYAKSANECLRIYETLDEEERKRIKFFYGADCIPWYPDDYDDIYIDYDSSDNDYDGHNPDHGMGGTLLVADPADEILTKEYVKIYLKAKKKDKKKMIIPLQFRIIDARAFEDNNDIEEVTGENIKAIKEAAFANCDQLESIDFKNVEKIESKAFYGCKKLGMNDINSTNLRTITLDKLSEVQEDSFENCTTGSDNVTELMIKISNGNIENVYKQLYKSGIAIADGDENIYEKAKKRSLNDYDDNLDDEISYMPDSKRHRSGY